MSFFAALKFLTIIPVPWRRGASPEELGRSIGYFPVVGIIIGLILAGLNWLLGLLLPSIVVNALLIVSMVVISGALHLDGFVDTCDGIAGHKTVEDRWRVMHDSRAGAFGIVGVFLLLLIKYVSLNVFAYPYARPAGLGKIFKQEASWQRFTAATVITLAVAVGLARLANITYFYLAGLVIMIGIWVIVVGMATYLKRKFSGLTGDTYGAINETTEVCVLILVCLLAHNQWLV